MHVTIPNFDRTLAALPVQQPAPVVKTLKLLHSVLERDEAWTGGCYMVAAVGHILLTEQGVNSTPCIGDVVCRQGAFDHAWLEIDGAIYDLAVSYPNDGCPRFPMVFGGLGFDGKAPTIIYGADPKSYDTIAVALDGGVRQYVESLTITGYLDGAAALGADLWSAITVFAKALGVRVTIEEIRAKYNSTRWAVRDSVPIAKEMMAGWTRLH